MISIQTTHIDPGITATNVDDEYTYKIQEFQNNHENNTRKFYTDNIFTKSADRENNVNKKETQHGKHIFNQT